MKKRSVAIGVATSVLMTTICGARAHAADGADQTTVVTTTAPATTVQVKSQAIDTRRLSADLISLGKLVQSGVDDKVVVTYIENSPPKRTPTAEELVYLHELGLSSDAMVALMNAVPKVSLTETQPVVAAGSERIVEPLLAQRPYQPGGTVQSAPVNGNTVISSPAPTVVYTQPPQPTVVYTQPTPPTVIVQQEPVVTYVEPRPRVTFGFSFGHLFGHHHGGHHWGHHGHHGRHHWGGHHGHHGGHRRHH